MEKRFSGPIRGVLGTLLEYLGWDVTGGTNGPATTIGKAHGYS